jgi:hypothetical protein
VIVENSSKFLLNEDRTAFLKVLKHVATILQKMTIMRSEIQFAWLQLKTMMDVQIKF